MASPHAHGATPTAPTAGWFRRSLGVFRYTTRAIELVWGTSKSLTAALAALTLTAGLLPPAIAFTGSLIIDAVVTAIDTGLAVDQAVAMRWIAVEAVLVIALAAAQKGLDVSQSLLRALLGHRVNMLILEKSLELELTHFEDPELYDQMTQARREASSRPLSLVRRSFGLIQNSISLASYAALLAQFSLLAVALLALAAVPAFIAETQFAGEAFRLFKWRSPEKRKQAYLEVVVAREDYAKEVKLLQIGPMLVGRYDAIFKKLFGEDRSLTLRRGFWGFALGLLSSAALYGAYLWVAMAAMATRITLGQMTMYLMVFKQGQSGFSAILQAVGGMYEDNLYLSNLYEFLDLEVATASGTVTAGSAPGDGIRFEGVSFTYPGATTPALSGVDLHIPPGSRLALVGHNGSGKTTLIKLLARLYMPSSGQILLDGTPLVEWEPQALRRRVGVIFQDFVRYQLTIGENIGVGDVPNIDDADRLDEAAEKGMAKPFIDDMPKGHETQLGRWFKDGRELSIGQWQKVALSRAFMREEADILVLDEPTAAMDAEAEAEIFQRLADLTDQQMAILISHRFSTVRMADDIVVLDQGQIVERGDHAALMAVDGRYAHMFTLQAAGYQ
ncbi:MAG: ABC transporter ATP-binding protein [Proteobacteria bacterium]|nr:ABC transporter ATP-binding protein [Pseudomonadota bacterium]